MLGIERRAGLDTGLLSGGQIDHLELALYRGFSKTAADGKGGAEEFNRRVKSASKIYLDTVYEIINLV